MLRLLGLRWKIHVNKLIAQCLSILHDLSWSILHILEEILCLLLIEVAFRSFSKLEWLTDLERLIHIEHLSLWWTLRKLWPLSRSHLLLLISIASIRVIINYAFVSLWFGPFWIPIIELRVLLNTLIEAWLLLLLIGYHLLRHLMWRWRVT